MKFRAVFSVAHKEPERCIYFEAPNRDEARQTIERELLDRYKCEIEDIEYYNLVSEFENPSAVNDFAVGWRGYEVTDREENPLILWKSG